MAFRLDEVRQGARNLLERCARTRAGDRLLIVHEPLDLTYYDPDLANIVADVGRAIGAEVTIVETPFDPVASKLPESLKPHMQASDQTVFLARIGDQIRFADIGTGSRAVISYALSKQMLGSAFGTANYDGFVALKDAIDQLIFCSDTIEVSCPSGTSFCGRAPRLDNNGGDTSICRFPMLIFTPVAAGGFSGKVAMPGFLLGTGSKYYQPYVHKFDGQVMAHFKDGRLTGFEGSHEDIKQAERHYDFVAHKYGIQRDYVHSWHAGIHPGCGYDQPIARDYERWGGSAFGNPRLLHFHTCGAYAPGEISWNITDPTVTIDGIDVWKDGVLHPENIPGGAEILAQYACCKATFENPTREIGY